MMKSLLEILKAAQQYLLDKKISFSKREAELLLAHVLSLQRMDLYLQYDRPLTKEEVDEYRRLIKRRGNNEPIAYIIGSVPFFGALIEVSKNVLIPRQETELLVDLIANRLSKIDLSNKVLIDVCTGSGCIAVSLKKRFPSLRVIGIDLSKEALETARKNALLNQVEVEFLEGDGLNPFVQKADFFVSNPPYVKEEEYEGLEDEVRIFEPKMALVSGHSGIEFYERFEKELPPKLNPGAKIFFEIGCLQGDLVAKVFSNRPIWRNLQIEKDYEDKDRFISLEFV